jgi:uncharacterized protein
MDLHAARHYILERLKAELSPDLYFHCYDHTLDVYHAAVRLIEMEKIPDECARLIETAALYHDAGMICQYSHHEEFSVTIAREALPRFGYSNKDIDKIAGAIMATKLPQGALNICEQVVCDADLDSLGREDFFVSSFKLRAEWEKFRIQKVSLKDWFLFEMNFLENHKYFTPSAIKLRQKGKEQHLAEIRDMLHL